MRRRMRASAARNTWERKLEELLFQGLTNREIGERLHLSPLTVRNHISLLLAQHQARNRTELLARFVDLRRRNHRRTLPEASSAGDLK